MYDYADTIIAYLNKLFITRFDKLKSLLSFDEMSVLGETKALYIELDEIVREKLFLLACTVYEEYMDGDYSSITQEWLYDILNDYDPITKYVYTHEVERKRARLAESILASQTKSDEIDTALRYWSAMVAQYVLEITDYAVLQAYRDNGVKKVMWVSKKDSRRCEVCKKRHGKIYDIDNMPPKPHIGCRCELEAIKEG